jgi:predicted nucleic acid-binding protein
MNTVVMDASALIPLFFQEEGTEASQNLLVRKDLNCVAPSFLAIEFSNVLATGMRRKRITPAEASRHLADFRSLPLDLRSFPADRDFQSVLDVAERTSLSFYDAIYLVLARSEDATLASFDKKLKSVAEQEGVGICPL